MADHERSGAEVASKVIRRIEVSKVGLVHVEWESYHVANHSVSHR